MGQPFLDACGHCRTKEILAQICEDGQDLKPLKTEIRTYALWILSG